MTAILVLGGVRSGKSTYAERLLTGRDRVIYVAPGPVPDPQLDADWAARVATHQARRPAGWRTAETGDVAGAIRQAVADGCDGVLVDCLGTWVTRLLDDAGAWDDRARAHAVATAGAAELAATLTECGAAGAADTPPIVLVSNEVGLGVIPAHRSGRIFRDLLGQVNATIARACPHVALVVAGRVLDLSTTPSVHDAPTYGL